MLSHFVLCLTSLKWYGSVVNCSYVKEESTFFHTSPL
jgi:hypothetical protein